MALPFTLPELETAMSTKIEDLGSIEAAIEACERMYNAMFRGDAVKISDVYDYDSVDERELYREMAGTLYAKFSGHRQPQREEVSCGCHHDCDCSSDSFMYASEAFDEMAGDWMKVSYPDFKITGDTMIVDFCNYKGEGDDGFGLYELHKHLPVFKSKSHSFNQVN
jgi:hypothetical protein